MAHNMFSKVDGNWKKIKKGWIKENTGWTKITKGWVKTTPTEWKLFFGGGFPKGIILPYNSTGALPIGWEEFDAQNGQHRSIIGADVVYPPRTYGGTGTVTHTGSVANAGTHGGVAYSWNASFNGDGDCAYCIQYDGDNQEGYNRGGHSHSNITGTVRTDPRKTEVRLIKASTDAGDLPPRVSILSAIDLPGYMNNNSLDVPNDMYEISSSGTYSGRYMGGGTAGVQDGQLTNLSSGVQTNYAGSHAHGGVWRTLWTSNSGEYAVNGGNHRHTGYVKATTNEYPYHYLSVWNSASDVIVSSPNMIGMWEGVNPPEGWAICNGTLGTPDLRNKFIRYADSTTRNQSGGTMRVGLGTFTDTNGAHNHRPSSQNSNGAATTLKIKHKSTVGHFHSSTDTYKTLTPPYYALTFIMKLPE